LEQTWSFALIYQLTQDNSWTDSSIDKEEFKHGDQPDSHRLLLDKFNCTTFSESFNIFPDNCPSFSQYGKMGSIEKGTHFKTIQSFKADYTDATFTQYESQRTGLRVVVVDRKGPKVCDNMIIIPAS